MTKKQKFSGRADILPFSPTFVLLQQEAFLARGSLSLGLTALRNATFPDKAAFYSGFFNTAVALERLMKLIVVTDHMLQNNFAAPTKADLKKYGHDIMTLYASCVGSGKRVGLTDVDMPLASALEYELLEFFSEFAMNSRYFNLDALSAASTAQQDPLARWGGILNDVLVSDAPKKKVAEHLAQAAALSQAMEGKALAIQHGMDGSQLTLEQVFSLPAMHTVAVPHVMVRLFRVLDPLLRSLTELGNQVFYGSPKEAGPQVPLFSEFFVHFGGTDADIRRKKRWP